MPIYEYECDSCGAIEEVFQKISDKPLKKCGRCTGKLHKLISQSSFHLKGTGWYVTDYAGKKSKPAAQAKSEKTADASTPKAQSPSTESKKSE